MTPREFLDKWRHAELKERSASQSHFNDLCALLARAKTGGGEGWAAR